MKKRFLLIASLLALSNEALIAQQNPTPYATPLASTPAQAVTTANAAWYRGGNNNTGPAGNANIFGTLWNSPIYTQTAGVNRSKLNGNLTAGGVTAQYSINGYGFGNTQQTVNTSGYMLLGVDGIGITDNQGLYNRKGAFSLLHLNGATTSNGYQEFGYRPWMKTGITFTGNRDLSYMGLRAIGDGEDITETTIAWSDNNNATNPGPDDMVFRFTSGGGAPINYNTDFSSNTDLDGLHVSRFTGNGLMGLGNTFGINVGVPAGLVYNTPRSLLHMSYQYRTGAANEPFGFMQITYRRANGVGADIIGQGEQATDGLRLGIDNDILNSGVLPYLNGYLRWQENSSFIIQTEDDGVASIQTNERMRITSIGALNNTEGNFSGLTSPINRTRIAISADGANPITRPLSLLHLGFNTGAVAITPSTDGWRPWMDLGIFTTNGSDNVYLGLKQETGPIGDRQDAVLSWGDNQTSGLPPGNGPDNFRMIFTSTTAASGGGTPPATGANGLEGLRMTPTTATGVFTGIGGDPTANQYGPAGNSLNPTATLEVNSWGTTTTPGGSSGLRFTNLNTGSPTIANPGQGVLSVNTNGDVVYVTGGGNINGAHNGTSMSLLDPTKVALGQDLNDPLAPAILLNSREIPMNNNNLYFTQNGRIGLGSLFTTLTPAAKLDIRPTSVDPIALSALNTSNMATTPVYTMNYLSNQATGTVENISLEVNTKGNPVKRAIGIKSVSDANSSQNIGVLGQVSNSQQSGVGGRFQAFANNNLGIGVQGTANFSTLDIGGEFRAGDPYQSTDVTNPNVGIFSESWSGGQGIAVYGKSSQASTIGIGVYGESASNLTSTNYGGYFVGTTVLSGSSILIGSDSTLKHNIQPIDSETDSLFNLIQTYKYEYNQTGNASKLGFSPGEKFGVLAQQVEQYFPQIIKEVVHPAKYDSTGVVVDPSFTYKAVDLVQLIPLMLYDLQRKNTSIAGLNNEIQNLNQTISTQDSTINDLNNRLTQLENCLSGILPFLCQLSQQAIETNTPAQQEEVRAQLSVRLANKEAIILDQNVPNPFAEQTVINFSIPATVQKAQIHFYDSNGKIIQSVDVVERGLGSLTVFGADLSTGIYTYTLVADGQIVATKKMMKE